MHVKGDFMSAKITIPKTNVVKHEIEYPASDGKPMAETDKHRKTISYAENSLELRYQDDANVYVTADLLIYYVKGNPHKRVAPDVFVVFGVSKHERRTYKIWEEGKPPSVVFEISSRETCIDDLNRKFRLYEELGIQEYFIFDPEYDYLDKPLIGFRLKNGKYVEIRGRNGTLKSEVLGLDLVDTGKGLRLCDSQTGEFLLTPAEEAEARRKAEDEVVKLREELARLKKSTR
jgi:Uma2 family endonuclease